MRTILFFSITILSVISGYSQQQKSERKYSTFYYQRATLFEELPITSEDIIFLGNSITNGGEWCELFDNKNVKNRGISSDVCYGVYDRLDAVLKGKPAKIFLLIGINDLGQGTDMDTIVARTSMIIKKIKKDSPKTKIYLQSILPVNDHFKMFSGHTSRWELVGQINKKLSRMATEQAVTYVDLYSDFADKDTGKLKLEYTNDGLHLTGKGYIKWAEILKPYVNNK